MLQFRDVLHFAALAYLDAASAEAGDRPDLSLRIALERSRSLRGLGRLVDARAHVLMARQSLSAAKLGVRVRLDLEASTLFEEGACLALAGDLDASARQLHHGLGLAGDRALTGRVEALGWLAVIEYFLGRAGGPGVHLAAAATLVGREHPLELAPALLAETLVALDEADTERAGAMLERLDGIADGTEFAAFALQLRAMLETSGALEQLDLLQAVELATHDWQAAALIRSLHDSERASALTQLGSFGAARDAVAGLPRKNPLHARHAHCPEVLAARLALHTGDYETVLASTAACRAMGDRHAPRSLAVVDVLRAAAHDGLGDAVTAAEPLDSIAPLSSRERIILSQIAAGQTRRQISSKLRVSPNTVKAQVRSIYRKLGASNRHEAIDRAIRFGITV